jgi:signal peptidase II
MRQSSGRNYHLIAWPALIIICLDQISKLAIVNSLRLYESLPVINGFFNLVHTRNRGMAFGLMNRPGFDFAFYFLVIATLTAVAIIMVWLFRLNRNERCLTLGLSLILGGALGNLIDRLRLREVVDFLDFYMGSYHWHTFNIADSAITVGTFLAAIILVFKSKKNVKQSNP